MRKISVLDDQASLILTHAMKSQAVKRSVVIEGRRKSISLEDAMWESLTEIAKYRGMTLFSLLATIDSKRKKASLSSAIRLFLLNFYREQLDIQRKNKALDAAFHSSIGRLH